MIKFTFLPLMFCLNLYAQTDDLTLESKTAPTVVEDGSDLSVLPVEDPQDAPDTVDVTENVNPESTIPAELPDTTPVVDAPATTMEEPTEMADSAPEELTTPNPIAEEDQPKEEPKVIAEQAPSPSQSTPVITTEAPKDDRFINHKKSHWITTFGFEGLKYELPFEFEGERKNVRDRDQELYGGRVGVGGQLYLGAGFFTTSKIEGYYVGTLTKSIQVADPDVEDEEAGTIKRTGGLYGAEVSQNLGFLFEFRTKNPFMDEWAYLTFEPFVEAGIGVARAYNAVDYEYDTGPSGIEEKYKKRFNDELTNARVGAGFNLTGRSGFFMTAKVTVNRFDLTKREVDSYARQDDGTITDPDKVTQKDVKIDPITVISIGGGYKF